VDILTFVEFSTAKSVKDTDLFVTIPSIKTCSSTVCCVIKKVGPAHYANIATKIFTCMKLSPHRMAVPSQLSSTKCSR